MISDSPYHAESQVMNARAGIAFGVLSAMVMLLLMALLQQLSGLNLLSILAHIGGITVPVSRFSDTSGLLIGTGFLIHLLIGALLGLLYTVSQQRIPNRGLIVVSIFYGFVVWIVNRLFFIPFFNEYLRTVVRSWYWLLACLLFGLCMGLATIWIHRRQPISGTVLPKD